MMAKHSKTDHSSHSGLYFQRLANGALNNLADPLMLTNLELDSGEDDEGTVVGEVNIHGTRGRTGLNSGDTGHYVAPPEQPVFRPSSVPRDAALGSRPYSNGHTADGRFSGLTTPGSGPELTRSVSLEAEASTSPVIGFTKRANGKEREVQTSSDDESVPVAGPSRTPGTRVFSDEVPSYQAQRLPVTSFDEPVYNRHSRRNQDSDGENEETTSSNQPSSPTRVLGVRRVLRNTLNDASALLFGRVQGGAGNGSGTGRPAPSR